MTSKVEVTECLVVVLTDEIALAVAPRCPDRSFVYENTFYEDQGFGDFTGFYDWLRNTDGRIIGVRYLPADELDFLCNAVTHLPYAVVDLKIKSIELYFSDDRRVDGSISNDQDFGDNRLFKSIPEQFALSFHADAVMSSLVTEAASKCHRLTLEQQ